MSNAEFYEHKENLADLIIILLRNCNCDETKINNVLWDSLVRQFKIIEEYV